MNMTTASGISYNPLDLLPKDIEIADIARGLGNICRYSGQVIGFYSVAEHSIYVADLLAHRGYTHLTQMRGLLHDASEAYLIDLPRPIKDALPDYKAWEQQAQLAILEALSVPYAGGSATAAVVQADADMLKYEQALIRQYGGRWDHDEAREMFLWRYRLLRTELDAV